MNYEQMTIWDGIKPYYKITKPIRLIELFAGIGSQHQALKNLGLKIDRTTICEWSIQSTQAYNDIHVRDYYDYSKEMTKDQIVAFLSIVGPSSDYNEPMSTHALKRKPKAELQRIYNNIRATNNLVNISRASGTDLQIVDRNKYEYILTYSFPCQDLSLAGKRAGMARDGDTRSGLLWEVERLLKETPELPQVLLMENVPDVIGTTNIKHFQEWELFLRQLGYSNHIELLNAKDYGIPQNRNRAFMVSILGDYQYRFPRKKKLTTRLKHLLEEKVDEKYFLNPKLIERLQIRNQEQITAGEIRTDEGIRTFSDDLMGTLRTTSSCGDKIAIVGNVAKNGREKGNVYDAEGLMPALLARDQKDPKKVMLKTKLAEQLETSGLLEEETIVNHSYTNSNKNPNSRLELEDFIERSDGITPTITTRVDTLGVAVPEDTKKGYAIAQDGDGIYINRPHQKRGVVQKGMVQTLKTDGDDIAVVVKTWNDETQAFKTKEGDMPRDRIYMGDSIGFAVTTAENHQPQVAVETEKQLRIRKLTPKECWRLMGFKDEQFDKAAKNQSNASLYHMAGDSIVVDVLEAIFKQLI